VKGFAIKISTQSPPRKNNFSLLLKKGYILETKAPQEVNI
jgi:hypothetical protein